jgi:ribosomal protein S18 acetylase RimI-like enzyme
MNDTDTALVRALELHSARAWPAPEIVRLNGWELRFTPGSRSRRVNSLTAIAPEPGRFEQTLQLARRLCRDRGLPCTVRLTPLAGAEATAALAGMGLPLTGDPTAVMVAPISRVQAPEGVVVEDAASATWLAGLSASGTDEAERQLVSRLVSSVTLAQGFAHVPGPDAPLAVGRAAAGEGLAGLFHIATQPTERRKGHGRQVVRALLAWARGQGAMRAYLQVVAANAPAVALYEGFGFREAYRYDYITVPDAL